VLERRGEGQRWFTIDRLCRCKNSIGSSTVMMWSARVRFARSTIDARVVDLPEPVGPVTSTRPRGRLAKFATTGGTPSCSSGRIS
jgi:hypothetical protein